MANLARVLKKYSDEIKHGIYQTLKGRRLRFDALAEACGRNRVTLSEYLVHAQEEEKVGKDPRSREYYLTPKGEEELDKLARERMARDAPFRYEGYAGSPWAGYFGWRAPAPKRMTAEQDKAVRHRLNRLPLPFLAKASLYGSQEIKIIYDSERDSFAKEKVRAKDVSTLVLDTMIGQLAAELVWRHLIRRFYHLSEWHDIYAAWRGGRLNEEDKKRYTQWGFLEKPPPVTLESLLGFDLSLNIYYNGKELLDRADNNIPDLKARENIRKRLVGLFLLRPAYGENMELYDCGLVDMLEKGALIEKKDASEIRKLMDEAGDHTLDRKGRQAIWEIARRYLQEGEMDFTEQKASAILS